MNKKLAHFSAWRKGDLVRLKDNQEIRLISDPYFRDNVVVCDTEDGEITYQQLIEEAFLIEDIYGVKNEIL